MGWIAPKGPRRSDFCRRIDKVPYHTPALSAGCVLHFREEFRVTNRIGVHKVFKLALSAAAFGILAVAATGGIAQDGPMKVGLLLPLQTPSGYETSVGAEMAVAEINAAGGILGRQVELVKADDQSNPTTAVAEVKRLIETEKIDALLGSVISQVVLAVSPHVVKADIIQFGVAGSSAVTPEAAPNFFSSYFNSDAQGETMFRYAAEDLKAKSIGILAESGSQAQNGVEHIKKLAAAAGVTVTGVQSFDARSPDFTPQLLDLKGGNPDVMLFWMIQQEDVVTYLKNVKDLGWDIKTSASGVGAAGANYVKSALGEGWMDNIHGTLLRLNTYCPGEPLNGSDWTGFLERIKAFNPKDVEKLNPGNIIMLYNATYALKAGAEGAGSLDPKAIREYMETHEVKIPTGISKTSPTAHFMIGADDIVTVTGPDKPREDGLIQRARCG